MLWQAGSLGTLPMDWPRPDGQPQTSRAWASPSRLLASMRVHWVLCGGWWPSQDVRYRRDSGWVPRFPLRFDLVVDHLSQVLLHRHSTSALLQACCEASDIGPRETITRDHAARELEDEPGPCDHPRLPRLLLPVTAMTPTSEPCCPEYAAISRRGLFAGAAALLGTTTAFGSAVLTTSAARAATPARSVMVVVSLRGAADGMSLVVPHGDPVYYQARPRIAVPADQLLVRDGFFGLHPELAPLVPWWNAGAMAAIHATGLPAPNRSHFSAMEEVEDADPGSDARVGWLNRLVGVDTIDSPLQAFGVGRRCSSGIPRRAGAVPHRRLGRGRPRGRGGGQRHLPAAGVAAHAVGPVGHSARRCHEVGLRRRHGLRAGPAYSCSPCQRRYSTTGTTSAGPSVPRRG